MKNNCEPCRQRKTKCDRVDPCGSCTKSGLTCVFVDRPKLPRGRGGGRRKANQDVVARLHKLETMVANAAAARQAPATTPDLTSSNNHADDETTGANPEPDRYLASSFWSTIGNEMNDLKELLEQSSSDDENYDHSSPGKTGSTSSTKDSQSFNFVLSASKSFFVTPGLLQHPPQASVDRICDSFLKYVDRIVKLVHRPTITQYLKGGGAVNSAPYLNHHQGHPGVEALIYSIYYATVAAESEHFSNEVLHSSRQEARNRFRFATEVCLARANFLDTREVVTLQALYFYAMIIRGDEAGMHQNSMNALLVQLARNNYLHIENYGKGLSVFEKQMRHHLWIAIRTLDYMTATDRGAEPLILEDDGNVDSIPRPLNINDEDYRPNSEELPAPRLGITDVTYIHLSSMSVGIAKRMSYHTSSIRAPRTKQDWESRHNFAGQLSAWCDLHVWPYVESLDPSGIYSNWLKLGISEMIAITKLFAVRPFRKHPDASQPPFDSKYILELAVTALRCVRDHDYLEADLHTWWMWVAWYVMAVAHAELCEHPDASDETWSIIESAYVKYAQVVAEGTSGPIWQRVSRLRKRAMTIRKAHLEKTGRVSIVPFIPGVTAPAVTTGMPQDFATAPMPYTSPSWMTSAGAQPGLTLPTTTPILPAYNAPTGNMESFMQGVSELSTSDVGWTNWNMFVDDLIGTNQPGFFN